MSDDDDRPIKDIFADAVASAAAFRAAVPAIRATACELCDDLDQAFEAANRTGRPALCFVDRRPIFVFPRGTRPLEEGE